MGQKVSTILKKSRPFTTLISIIFGFLAFKAHTAPLAGPDSVAQLAELNEQWPITFANKSSDNLPGFYTADALMAQYPYQASQNLKGLNAITNMFESGPFRLTDASVQTWTIAMDARESTGLILKRWQLKHSGGEFSGLAIKVAAYEQDRWYWDIELSGGGLRSLSDFARNDTEPDNSAFDYITTRLLDNKGNEAREQNREQPIDLDISKTTQMASQAAPVFNNLLAIENKDKGLLITKVTRMGYEFISFIALARDVTGEWKTAIRLTKRLAMPER